MSSFTGNKIVALLCVAQFVVVLDVTVVTDIARWRYPAMLPRLFRGTHVDGVRVRALRGRDIRVITPHVGDVYADGDLLEASPTTFRALPDALRVLVPAP